MSTLYDILEIHDEATDDELKRAYRRAAMKAHPDRNVGREASANKHFQEIKEAYAILSDPVQRRVYDAVYAEEMQRHASEREAEEQRLQAEREAQYTRYVTLAMRFAEQGHNRDVVLGVLLGHDCDMELAGRVADSVVALHASRKAKASEPSAEGDASESDVKSDTKTGSERAHPNIFNAIWQGMFGLQP